MAIVTIEFDAGNVPVVTGEEPDSPDKPIENPVDTHRLTNQFIFVGAGFHVFSLKTDIAFTPLWQKGQAIDGVALTLTFKRVQ